MLIYYPPSPSQQGDTYSNVLALDHEYRSNYPETPHIAAIYGIPPNYCIEGTATASRIAIGKWLERSSKPTETLVIGAEWNLCTHKTRNQHQTPR